MLTGLIVSALVAAVALGPWLADMVRAGLVRENYAGHRLAFPAGAPLIACSLIALAPLAVLDDRADLDLLDLRPGRAEKGLALLGLGLCLGAWTIAPLELLGIFAGAVAVGAWFTLRERAMLGDTGSNLIGALAGVAMLVTLGDTGRWIALALIVALTIFGEFRSISRTIDSIPPLRWIDSLGRVSRGDLNR